MKYIDAERLIAEIEKLKNELKSLMSKLYYAANYNEWEAELNGYNKILSLIDSLMQEQPEADLVVELKHHLATTPKEQLEKEWKELEIWDNIGPTIQEFLYGKQSAVDLEKE